MNIIQKDKIKHGNAIQVDTKFLKNDLERYYINEKKSMLEISRIYGCSAETIANKLKKYEIYIRPYGAFLVDDDGNTLSSKHNKNEITTTEYYDELSKRRGFKDYKNHKRQQQYEKGIGTGLSMSENKKCSKYLGVHICENKEFLSKIINIIESMPENNPGYDVLCTKNKKIDVKCSCLRKSNTWDFNIQENKIADYFLMISFDDRENLNVQHIWLVKGDAVIEKTNAYQSEKFVVNKRYTIHIGKGNIALKRWIKHEITDIYKMKEVQKVCDYFKNDNKNNIK